MLSPKKVQHRKWHKGRSRNRGLSMRGTEISFGTYGLKATSAKWVSSRQIEAARRTIIRYLRKGGKLWIRIFPDKPVTKKGEETPMGGGKGSPDHYVAAVRPGRVLFEIDGISEEMAKEAFRKASTKLPLAVKFIKRA